MSFSLQFKTKDGKNSIKTGGKAHVDVLAEDFKFEADDNIGIYAMNRDHPYHGALDNTLMS